MSYLPSTSTGRSLVNAASASAGRTVLGLGTIATQDSNNVSITGGSISGITLIGLEDVRVVNSTPVTLDANDKMIFADTDTAATAITLNLPTTVPAGTCYIVKRKGADSVTIDAGSGNTIDGSQTYVISTNAESITIVCVVADTSWAII